MKRVGLVVTLWRAGARKSVFWWVAARNSGFACDQRTTTDTTSAITQTHSAKTAWFQRFHPMGLHFGGHTTTNRGHAAANRGELRHARVRHAGDTPTERFAWRKTPTGHRSGGRWREWWPGGLGRGAGGGDGARPRKIPHVISDGHFLRPPKNVAIPTR